MLRKIRKTSVLFSIIVAILLCAANYLALQLAELQFKRSALDRIAVEATVVDVDLNVRRRLPDVWEVTVVYEVDGVEYHKELRLASIPLFEMINGTDYDVGDKIGIFYSADDHSDIVYPNSSDIVGIYRLGGMCVVVFAYPIFKYLYMKKPRDKK